MPMKPVIAKVYGVLMIGFLIGFSALLQAQQIPVITSPLAVTGTAVANFIYQITASNSPTKYNATRLPDGLYLDQNNGSITGDPINSGSFNATISAINASGTGSGSLVIILMPHVPFVYNNCVTPCSFTGANGANPYSGLVQGIDGNFYGTTEFGGSSNMGTVFKINSTGSLTTLCSFSGTSGVCPGGGPVGLMQATDGNFYGLTLFNSINERSPSNWSATGMGTVFKINSSGLFSSLCTFNGTNGAGPNAGLVQGNDGNLYGTAQRGGNGGGGTVFMVTLAGSLTSLWSFMGTDGAYPQTSLFLGSDGNFYGTTSVAGSYGYGTVFKINSTGSLATIYSFSDFNSPQSSLIQGNDGNFYGSITRPGTSYGSIYTITSSGSLSTFCPLSGFDGPYLGKMPGQLILGTDGSVCGTAIGGSESSNNDSVVFRITPDGSLTTVCTFTAGGFWAGSQSFHPNLLEGNDGNFYGTTYYGGTSGSGSIFKVCMKFSTTVGLPFNYQIHTADSPYITKPTSFSATGLPDGLIVDANSGLISGTPTTLGNYNVTIGAANEGGTGTAAFNINILTPYAAWQKQMFTVSDLSISKISGDTATPSGDGITNLMKYALNLNPKTNGVNDLPVLGMVTDGSNNTYMTLTYKKLISASDISYVVEVSNDLVTWNSGDSVTASVGSSTANPDGITQTVVIQDLTPMSNRTQRFIRLKVTMP
jgi:uncharacterized repeat protein (TIGR03803 family)